MFICLKTRESISNLLKKARESAGRKRQQKDQGSNDRGKRSRLLSSADNQLFRDSNYSTPLFTLRLLVYCLDPLANPSTLVLLFDLQEFKSKIIRSVERSELERKCIFRSYSSNWFVRNTPESALRANWNACDWLISGIYILFGRWIFTHASDPHSLVRHRVRNLVSR